MFNTSKEFKAAQANLQAFRMIVNHNNEVSNWDKTYDNIALRTPDLIIELQEAVISSNIPLINEILSTDTSLALKHDRFGNTAMSLAMELNKLNIVNLIKQKIRFNLGGKMYA